MAAKKSVKKTAGEGVEKPAPAAPVLALNSLRTPFSADGMKVFVDRKPILIHVGRVTLLNTTVRGNLNPAQSEVFDDILYELRNMERELIRVERFADYINPEAQLENLLASGSKAIKDYVVKLGMDLTDAEIEALAALTSAKKKFSDFFRDLGALYTPLGKKAQGENPLAVEGDNVSNGRNRITLRQARNVWNRAFAVWNDGKQDSGTSTIRKDWESHRIRVYDNRVEIGCQTISRWQAEDLAQRQNWITV